MFLTTKWGRYKTSTKALGCDVASLYGSRIIQSSIGPNSSDTRCFEGFCSYDLLFSPKGAWATPLNSVIAKVTEVYKLTRWILLIQTDVHDASVTLFQADWNYLFSWEHHDFLGRNWGLLLLKACGILKKEKALLEWSSDIRYDCTHL